MGAFDDLIPTQRADTQPTSTPSPPSSGGAFADLIPSNNSPAMLTRQIGGEGVPHLQRPTTADKFMQAVKDPTRNFSKEAYDATAMGKFEQLMMGVHDQLKIENTLPALLVTRFSDVAEARKQAAKNQDWDNEIDRRKAAGESNNGMEVWWLKHLNDIIDKKKNHTGPDPSLAEQWDATKQAFIDYPYHTIGTILGGFATNPELMLVGPAGSLGIAMVESTLRQLNEKGHTTASESLMDTAMFGGPMVLHGAIGAGAKGIKSAVQGSQRAVVAASNIAQILKDATEMAKEKGISPDDALDTVIGKYKLRKGDSKKIAEAVVAAQDEMHEHFAAKEKPDADRDQSGQVLPEAQGQEGKGERGEDMPKLDRPESKDGQTPETEEKEKVSNADKARQLVTQNIKPLAAAGAVGATVAYGESSPEDKKKWVSVGMVAPMFYSPLGKAVFGGKGVPSKFNWDKVGEMKADQFHARLDSLIKNGTINGDEVNYTGLREYIDFVKSSGEPIRKEAVDQFLRDHGVKIEERILGAPDRHGNRKEVPYERYTLAGFKEADSDRVLLFSIPELKPGDPTKYRIQHFDKTQNPNTFAHVRFNIRFGPGGGRSVFIDEVQADMQGNLRRFGTQRGTENMETMRIEERIEHFKEKIADAYDFHEATRGEDSELDPHIAYQVREWEITLAKLNLLKGKVRLRVPEAVKKVPFVTEKDAWLQLMLKRMVRYAVENNYDIAWTTADQQIARYPDERTPEEQKRFEAGMRAAYDHDLPKAMRKVLEDLGDKNASIGKTRFGEPFGQKSIGEQPSVSIPKSVRDKVLTEPMSMFKQQGMARPEVLGLLGLGTAGFLAYAMNKDGSLDVERAVKGGALALGAAIVAKSGRGLSEMMRAGARKPFTVNNVWREMTARVNLVNLGARNWYNNVDALLGADKSGREASYVKVRDYLQGHRDQELSPAEMAYADQIRRFLDESGEAGKIGKVLPKELLIDYLTGLYKKPSWQTWEDVIAALNQNDAFRGNYTGMSPHSRFAMKKSIPDYRTLERLRAEGKVDLVPLTNDPAKIAWHYSVSLNKTVAIRNLRDTLLKLPSPDHFYTDKNGAQVPFPVLMPNTPDGAAAAIIRGNAIMGKKLQEPPELIAARNKIQIVNALNDYVPLKHATFEGYRIHKDLADPLKLLFDTSDPGAVGRAIYNLSMGTKSLLFMGSLFHVTSLGVAALAGTLPRALTGKEFTRLPRFWTEITGAYQMLHNAVPLTPISQLAAETGLNFTRPPEDVNPEFAQRAFELTQKYAGDLTGAVGMRGLGEAPFKAAGGMHRWFNHLLWDIVHPTLKLATFTNELRFAVEKNLKEHNANPEKVPLKDPKQMAFEISKATNDMYGGINWGELANSVEGEWARKIAMSLFSPSGRRMQQIVFLAPDWNIAATRAWYEGLKAVTPGVSRKASDSMYRGYLFWSALTYIGAANYLNNKYVGHNIWENEDPTMVELPDGRRLQLNKHFMEVVHAIRDPSGWALNKFNYLPKEATEQVLSKEFLTKTGGPPMIDTSVAGRSEHALAHLMPIFAQNLSRDPYAAVSGFLGFPIWGYTPEEAKKTAAERVPSKLDPEASEKAQDTARKRATKQGKTDFEVQQAMSAARERVLKRRQRIREEAGVE